MTDFAGRYDEVLFGTRGGGGNNALVYTITDATVTVYESDGSTVATIYTDRDKATEGSNPKASDSAGNFEFFADPGTYVLSVSVGGEVVTTNTVVVPVDPADAILEIADEDVAIWLS